MGNTDLNIYFWTDSNGNKRVAYGNATHISPYDLSMALSAKRYNSIKANSHHGKLSSERYKLHNQIIKDYFKGKTPYGPNDDKVAYFTGGGPASGKGTFSHNIKDYYSKDDNPVVIDPDDIKELLIAADGKKMSHRNTTFYHSESLMLANRIFEIASQNNYPTLYDGTATNYATIMAKVRAMKNLGYKTEMRYMVSDVNTLLNSSLDRYQTSGRLVDLTSLLSTHQNAQSTAPKLFEQIDDMKLYNRKGNVISLVATGGVKGGMNVKDQKVWDNFQNQGAYTITKDAYDTYMERYNKIKTERGE